MNWSYKGTALSDLGIVTQVSDAFKMPDRRAENMLVPYRHGRVFVEKYFEQRKLVLGLEIVESSVQLLEEKLDTLKALLSSRSLGTLQVTLENGSIRTAQAELSSDMSPVRNTPNSVKLVLEFTLPDPFFYGDTLGTNTTVIDASPTAYTVNNPGTVEKINPRIVLTGPLVNPVITNSTNGVSLSYVGSIASGHDVTVDIDGTTGEFTAVTDLLVNVIGNIEHSGSPALMVLEPGDNNLSVTADTPTTGEITIEFYPPYV